jgi:hypothetical protein
MLSTSLLKKLSLQWIKIVGILIFTGFEIIITFPIVIAPNTVFIEKIQVGNRAYYLPAYPIFAEVNYSIAECEFTAQFCRTIFISGDIAGTNWLAGHLKYDVSDQEIMLVEAAEGIIFLRST